MSAVENNELGVLMARLLQGGVVDWNRRNRRWLYGTSRPVWTRMVQLHGGVIQDFMAWYDSVDE